MSAKYAIKGNWPQECYLKIISLHKMKGRICIFLTEEEIARKALFLGSWSDIPSTLYAINSLASFGPNSYF